MVLEFHRSNSSANDPLVQQPLSSLQPLFPNQLAIIGHDFKRKRFEEVHIPAIRWPAFQSRFKYIGVDPPMDSEKRAETVQGEILRGYGAWMQDQYGTGRVLRTNRPARGGSDDKRAAVKALVCRGWARSSFLKDVEGLLEWTGGPSGSDIYPITLPWELPHDDKTPYTD